MTLVHLPFSVRSLDLFVALLVFMKRASCCVIKRSSSRAELLDCAIANFRAHRSSRVSAVYLTPL